MAGACFEGRIDAWLKSSVPDLAGKVFIVTGANSGIGSDATRMLAQKGATVVLACRSETRAQDAIEKLTGQFRIPRERFEFIRLDLNDLVTVQTFAKTFRERHDRLDSLVCNAGVMAPAALQKTEQGHEVQFGTNMLGHYALIAELLPSLAADPSRRTNITLVSSGAHFGCCKIDLANLDCAAGYKAWPRYFETKLGDLLIMTHLTKRLKKAGIGNITVTACHPGYSATNLQNDTWFAFTNIIAQHSVRGAMPTVMAATNPSLKSGDYIGPYFFSHGGPAKAFSSCASRNEEHAAAVCEHMDGLIAAPLADSIARISQGGN